MTSREHAGIAGRQAAKVFRAKTYDRQKLEKYYTPAWVTEALLRHFDLRHTATVWEPAAGNGAIVDVLQRHGHGCVGTDISPEGSVQPRPVNFIGQATFGNDVGAIVTNPPFGPGGMTAYRFVCHALRLMRPRNGRVAMLMRGDFDSAGGRTSIFKDHPAWDTKIVLTERIRWTNLPQKAAGPSGNHAWYIWDWSREPGPAQLVYEGSKP